MELEIIAIGGYDEIGANMTAVRVDNTTIIIDMGLHVDKIVSFGERENVNNIPIQRLYEIEAVPDDRFLADIRDTVKAIVISHAHLDHVGAVHILAPKYNAPIYATPYTMEVMKSLAEDAGVVIPNTIKKISPNSKIKISRDVEVEFISITHSIPQAALINIKTPKGYIVYACDYKFDNFPLLGKRPDYNKLKQLGEEGVLALIVETTRAEEESKSQSEIIAKYMLYDVLSSVETSGIIVTTFASHIARLKSLIEIAYELDRKPVFIGRSMGKYIKAAENIGLVNFENVAEIYSNARDYPRVLGRIDREREKYLLIVTGHQGEPGSVLDRMAKDQLPWDFKDTTVIFANNVIPYPINEANRKLLEERIKRKGGHIIKDVHVSGHAKAEDHRMLLRMLKPEYIFPTHGSMVKRAAYIEMAEDFNYQLGEDTFLLQNGQRKILDL